MKDRVYRISMSLLLILWVTTGVAKRLQDTSIGGAVYEVLAPAQTALALSQAWAMFAPPPSHAKYLGAEGKRADGSLVELEPLFEALDDSFFRWGYDRLNKVSMIAAKKKSVNAREAVALWMCRRAVEEGDPLVEITVFKETARMAKPRTARRADYPGLSFKRVDMGTWSCPD